jgi:hypothetical protein
LKINSAMTSFEYPMGFNYGTWGTARGGSVSFVPVSAIDQEVKYRQMDYVLLSASFGEGTIENGSGQRIEDIPEAFEMLAFNNTIPESRLFALPNDAYTIEPSATMNVAMASSDAYVMIEGLGANDKLYGDMTSAKLFDVETVGASTFNVSCMSKDTGLMEIEMEVTSMGSFSAEVSGGKLKILGDAQVRILAGAEVVDQGDEGMLYTIIANYPDKGVGAAVRLVELNSEIVVDNPAGPAVFSFVPEGSYNVEVRYYNGETISQVIRADRGSADSSGVVSVYVGE